MQITTKGYEKWFGAPGEASVMRVGRGGVALGVRTDATGWDVTGSRTL